MSDWNIWVYRPDKCNSKIHGSGLYNSKGQSYSEWKRDQETIYDYKVRRLIQKIEGKPDYQVYDYWR